ncbi:ABC transporter ATP-binding protein [soil metagenome]
MAQGNEILRVDNLSVYYHTPEGPVKAVEKVSFTLNEGERLGLVGESGSGKSTIALALMRMIRPPGRVQDGQVILDGVDLLGLNEESMRKVRLAHLALVAQGAMNSLNPVKRIKEQFKYSLRDHDREMKGEELEAFIAQLLQRVGLQPAVANMFPHELSGGMKQRVCIAIAISLNPQVIIADEPTSALDVVVQWQVIETLRKVQEELGAAVVQIGHDMGLMAQSVEKLGVMYAGKLIEIGPTEDVFKNPLHPYTQLLIESLPTLENRESLHGIPGLPPSLLNRDTSNCPFHPRCPHAMDRCTVQEPRMLEIEPGHLAACHLLDMPDSRTIAGDLQQSAAD